VIKATLLAVDLSYQVYRAAAAHPLLTSGPTFTGGLYGFLTTLAKQIRETGATRVVCCRDMKPYRRSVLWPDYKLIRKKQVNDELLKAFQQSMLLVLECLPVLGVPTMAYDGFESDDCIGWIAKTQRARFSAIYAASNDSDLYQLLRYPNFKVLRKDLADLVTVQNLAAGPLGMTPEEFMLASALQGTHNDVAGIPKIGPVSAYKAVKDPALMRTLRERWAPMIDRNLELIKLPHEEFPTDARLPAMLSFDQRALYRFCGRFEIEVTKSMVDSFHQVSAR
jgi:5'-3' exonuclease